MCLFERIFTHYINKLQGKDDLKVYCKCSRGFLNQSLFDILDCIKYKRENDPSEETQEGQAVEGCECINSTNTKSRKFSDYFCIDCLKFVCKECNNNKINYHYNHRVFNTRNLIKYIRGNIKNTFLKCPNLKDFEDKLNKMSKQFLDLVEKNLNRTVRKLDELITSAKELKKYYMDNYQIQMENNILTFKIIKLYYMIFFTEKNIETTKENVENNDIFRLKYINNISYEFINFTVSHSKAFDEELETIKNRINKIQMDNFEFIQSKFNFEKIKKNYSIDTLDKMLIAHNKFITSLITIKNKIISASTEFSMKVYENESGQYVVKQTINFKPVRNLLGLKNEKFLASTTNTNDIFVFVPTDKDEYRASQSLTKHNKPVISFIELNDGKIVSISIDGNIIIWEEDQGIDQYNIKQEININRSVTIGVLLDEFKFALCGENGIIYIYKAKSNIESKNVKKNLLSQGKENDIEIPENKIQFLSMEFEEICQLEKHKVRVLCINKLNDEYFASGGEEIETKSGKNIYIWKSKEDNYILEQIIYNAHDAQINSIILLRDGRIASSSRDRTIKIWGFKSYEKNNNKDYKYVLSEKLDQYGHGLYKLIQLNDNRLLVSTSDNNLLFWRNSEGLF